MPTGADAQNVDAVSFCGPGSSQMAIGKDNARIQNAELGFAERLGKIKNFSLQLFPFPVRTDIRWGWESGMPFPLFATGERLKLAMEAHVTVISRFGFAGLGSAFFASC
jgi:hypothetical protein